MDNKKKISILVLSLILLVGGFLRLYSLTAHDMVADDALNSFRSIGYFDYLAAEDLQSTPVSWFEEKTWWQNLSFHDHPPLSFIIQNIFFNVFGNNVLAARLPFALSGIVTILLLYKIVHKIKNEAAALATAAIAAVANYSVWISRIGFIESLLIAVLLSAILAFLKAQENTKYYYLTGLLVGLGLVTKYTFIFLLGHFDAALSSVFGMQPAVFQGLEREVSVGFNSLLGILQNLYANTSRLFLVLFSVSFLYFCIDTVRTKNSNQFLVLMYLIFFGCGNFLSRWRF